MKIGRATSKIRALFCLGRPHFDFFGGSGANGAFAPYYSISTHNHPKYTQKKLKIYLQSCSKILQNFLEKITVFKKVKTIATKCQASCEYFLSYECCFMSTAVLFDCFIF